MHEIKSPKIEAEKPRHLNGKTAMEIVEYMRDHFKTDFTDDMKQVPLNKSTAYLIAVSNAVFDPANWKNPVKVWFGPDEWVKAAIIWYHAAEPHSNGYWVYSPGYQAW